MFDLAKNIREVKMQFASITEALSFSAATKKTTGKSIPASKVQAITEGLDNSVVSNKPTKEIISEQALSKARFMELAGIKPVVNK